MALYDFEIFPSEFIMYISSHSSPRKEKDYIGERGVISCMGEILRMSGLVICKDACRK